MQRSISFANGYCDWFFPLRLSALQVRRIAAEHDQDAAGAKDGSEDVGAFLYIHQENRPTHRRLVLQEISTNRGSKHN
jgi:hypothetical protein